MSDLKDNIEIGVDATGVETGVGRAKQSLASLGTAAADAGSKGAAGLGKMGDGGKQAADKLERDTRRMISQLQRVNAEVEAGGRNTAAYFEARARQMGIVNSTLQQHIDKLRASEIAQAQAARGMQNMSISAGQMSAAMRGLPAQMQDIVVSLQGGQRPMTVLLQQGSQITSQFGSMGEAVRGVVRYLAGFVTPTTAIVGALAALGGVLYASNRGLDELQSKVDNAGRSIGYTTSQLWDMASAMNTGWGQSANAQALTEIATSAQLSTEELRKFTELAVDLEKHVGKPVADTAAWFKMLQEEPAKAVKKMADEIGGLTAAQYDQIKALDEQGKKTDAARLGMSAFADAVKPSVDRAKAQLGALGTAMDFWRRKANDMWAAIAGVARAATGNETADERIAAAQKRVQSLESPTWQKDLGAWDSIRSIFNPDKIRAETLAKARDDLHYLTYTTEEQAKTAQREQQREARDKAARDAIDAVGKAFDGALTKGQRMNKELAEFRGNLEKIRAANPDSALLDPKRIAAAEAAIRDQYKENGGGGGSKRTAAAPGESEVARIRAMIAEEEAYTRALQERGEAATRLSAGEKLVMQIQQQLTTSIKGVARTNKEAALAEAEKLVAAEKARSAEERRIKLMQEATEANERLVADTWKTADGLERQAAELDASNAMWGKGKIAVEEYRLQQAQEMLAMAEASDSFIPEYVEGLRAIVAARQHLVEASKDQVFNQLNEGIAEWARQAEERSRLFEEEAQLAGLTALERAKIVAQREIELRLAKEIDKINKSGLEDAEKQQLISAATAAAAIDKSAAVARVVQEDWSRTADQVNQSLTDALLRGFESGKDFAGNFRDTLVNMFKTLVLKPVISFIVQPIGNAITGMVNGFLGGGQGGGMGGLMGNASNLQSAYSWLTGGYQNTLSNIASFFGFGGGYGSAAVAPAASFAPTSWGAQGVGAMYTTPSFATGAAPGTFAGTPSAVGSTAPAGVSVAGLAAIAAPLIVGMLAERNSRDRYGGAAYATSDWRNDPFVNAVGADFNALTGDIPNREALIERAITAGIERSTVDLFNGNDRALLHYIRMAEDPNRNEFGGLPDPRKLIADGNLYEADFYRGQGFASPEEMGWWNNKGGDLTAVDPRVVEASRALSLSIVGPLSDMARMLGDAEADFRVTTGFANRGKGALWGALDIQRGGESIGGFDQSDLKDVQEYMRAVYSEAMDAFGAMDLPEWARGQVEGAQTAMDALKGDKIGEEAAALYQQTATAVAQTFGAIQRLIDIFPDFTAATQDAVHALGEAMGGLDALSSAYSGYIQEFWSEAERFDLMRAQIAADLGAVGLSLPDTRDAFRDLVEAQNLNTEAGRAAFAALMNVAGAFAQITPAAESAANTVSGVKKFASGAEYAGAASQSAASQIKDAWKGIADTLIEQVKRIRGELADSGQNSLAYWQAQFAIDTAAARAGDQEAAERLVGISNSLLDAAERDATSLLELQQTRAAIAQSLQDTAGYAVALGGSASAGGAAGGTGGGSLSDHPWAAAERRAAAESRALLMRDRGMTAAEYDAWLSAQNPIQTSAPSGLAITPYVPTTGEPADAAMRDMARKLEVLTEQNREQARVNAELSAKLVRIFQRWDAEGMPQERDDA